MTLEVGSRQDRIKGKAKALFSRLQDGFDSMMNDILLDREVDFMDSRTAALHRLGSRFAYILSLAVLAFVVVFFIWASLAKVEEVTRGNGRVIPSSRIQVVQNLEGGILSEINVRNGDLVEAGDVLVRIDNVMAQSSYREARGNYLVHLAAIARLEAELAGEDPVYPAEIQEADPNILRDQMAQGDARLAQYRSQLAVLQAQADQKGKEVEELRSQRQQLRASVALVQRELDITKPLYEKGVVSQLDLLRVEEKMTNQAGELRTINLTIPRAESAFEEANQRTIEFMSKHKAEIAQEISEKRAALDALEQRLAAGADRVVRTDVRSPVRGTIKDVKATTIGGVIQPGQDIVEIVPIDDTLLIEAQIRPSDIAFLRPGQPATIKVTAYDFSIYGGLEAELEQISADTIKDEQGEEFYRILLRTGQNTLVHENEQLSIIPGMTATVEILTGEKTVLSYLLKPILKARQEALRER